MRPRALAIATTGLLGGVVALNAWLASGRRRLPSRGMHENDWQGG